MKASSMGNRVINALALDRARHRISVARGHRRSAEACADAGDRVGQLQLRTMQRKASPPSPWHRDGLYSDNVRRVTGELPGVRVPAVASPPSEPYSPGCCSGRMPRSLRGVSSQTPILHQRMRIANGTCDVTQSSVRHLGVQGPTSKPLTHQLCHRQRLRRRLQHAAGIRCNGTVDGARLRVGVSAGTIFQELAAGARP